MLSIRIVEPTSPGSFSTRKAPGLRTLYTVGFVGSDERAKSGWTIAA